MMKRSAVLLVCAVLAVSACATPGTQPAGLQDEVRQSVAQSQARQQARNVVLPAALALPMWPGHALAPACVKDETREACVIVGDKRNEANVYNIRDAYIAVLEANGWQMQWPREEAPVLLRTTSGPQRCVRISFGVWDDGRSARITLKPMLRFELDPYMIDCANPGDGPPKLPVLFPAHQG
jgi:hypothetical protein